MNEWPLYPRPQSDPPVAAKAMDQMIREARSDLEELEAERGMTNPLYYELDDGTRISVWRNVAVQ